MIGEHAFCPTSGASLSREVHYDDRGRPERTPQSDDLSPNATLEAPLTTGARRSSRRALLTYFRRCHRRHADADDECYRRAALALARLKRTASGRDERDVVVWFALGERLAYEGFDVEWMAAHADPRCPDCGARLSYASDSDGLVGYCGVSCRDERTDRLAEIRETVRSLFARTYPDEPTPETDALTLL
ncbi:hypothetical protein [Halobiforma nitratireducens]|uniref:Uncharacterized protein n=1 Tax=Halobiforma nitratireducens JCM 10879 TaxID=1227454 RepID=M0LUI5_9EURY|nr:hypothetical protein [Halobiforma nitratireducens]EMA36833.1 hypothetical protein C446_11127 [Halobiforma nitratireducens JCM 10879]